jgi:hypothetical protein
MDEWPEFVRDGEAARAPRMARARELTGWEAVVFEVADAAQEPDGLSSAFSTPVSTAAFAP